MKKILFTTSVITALALTSVGAYAATAYNDLHTQVPSTGLVAQTSTSQTEERIQYLKETSRSSDGTVKSVYETWLNPVTHDRRYDTHDTDENGAARYESLYILDNSKTMVRVTRDAAGNILDGAIQPYSDRVALYNNNLSSARNIFEAADLHTSDWKPAGTVEENGKTLSKLFRTTGKEVKKSGGESYALGETTEFAYLDATSGLPVRFESYDGTGSHMKLISTQVDEYDRVAPDVSLFDTSTFHLKTLPVMDFDPANSAG